MYTMRKFFLYCARVFMGGGELEHPKNSDYNHLRYGIDTSLVQVFR